MHSEIFSDSQKRPKAKANTDQSIKHERSVGQAFSPLRVYSLLSMPHHIEDGDKIVGRQPSHVKPDSQSGSLCTEVICRFETVDSDKEGTSSDVHLMRHAS